jgi:hypothetical protein
MEKTNFSGLLQVVTNKMAPMIDEIIGEHSQNVHSIYIVGSAIVPDFDERLSNINSIVLLHAMNLKFIDFLAPLGGKYARKRIAAPLVMTPEYISKSIDEFPVEFLDFKLLHKTVFGEDITTDIKIKKQPLRIQCGREIKIKLFGLRQGYLSSMGKKEYLTEGLIRSITGSMSLFRAIINLLGNEPPMLRADVIKAFGDATGIKTDIFTKLLLLKGKSIKPSDQELRIMFEQYYKALESIEKTLDDLHA